jgi:hypothetical protein
VNEPRSPAAPRWWLQSARALAARPDLWWTGVVELRSLTPRRWWRRWPPLPLPDKGWMAFRMETAYGDSKRRPPADDTLAWLSWCRQERAVMRRPAGKAPGP